jgi:hypothetical protein
VRGSLCDKAEARNFRLASGARNYSHGRRGGSSGRRLEQATSSEERATISQEKRAERARRNGELTDGRRHPDRIPPFSSGHGSGSCRRSLAQAQDRANGLQGLLQFGRGICTARAGILS